MAESVERKEALTRVSPSEFRRVLGHWPTGVTIITACDVAGQPVGMAANSLTSVSLVPPMILVCPGRESETWPVMRAAGQFCVNVLASHHESMCRRFAEKGGDRFRGVKWVRRRAGPALEDALAWLQCEIRTECEAGDHTVVLADVCEVEAAAGVAPLVFFQGRYGTVS